MTDFENFVLNIFQHGDTTYAMIQANGWKPGVIRLRRASWRWLALLGLWVASWALGDETPKNCEICKGPFGETVYVADDHIRQVKKHICLACSKSKVTCSACGLAANPRTLRKLDDGRVLCELDAKGAVLSETEAREIFHEVKREVQRMLAHWSPLPDMNVTAYLVNRNDFIKEFHRKASVESPEKLLGLTHSTSDGTNHEHRIYLLSGVLKPEFMATCAHEYTHAWLNEHSTMTRTLHKDTVEGYCELVSWKFVAAKKDTNEMNRILESDYTRGQIDALITAEQRYQFHRVIDWIHRGEDSWLDQARLERLLALKTEPEAEADVEPLWQLPAVPTTVPGTLVLRGLSGTGERRLALINDQTLGKSEEARVRVGQTNVMVRCVEIREHSVLLRVNKEAEPFELFLPPK